MQNHRITTVHSVLRREMNIRAGALEAVSFLLGCSLTSRCQKQPVIEYLVRRQGQTRGAQVYAVHLIDQKGWRQDLSQTSFKHWQGGGEGLLLEIPVYLKAFPGKQFFPLFL